MFKWKLKDRDVTYLILQGKLKNCKISVRSSKQCWTEYRAVLFFIFWKLYLLDPFSESILEAYNNFHSWNGMNISCVADWQRHYMFYEQLKCKILGFLLHALLSSDIFLNTIGILSFYLPITPYPCALNITLRPRS